VLNVFVSVLCLTCEGSFRAILSDRNLTVKLLRKGKLYVQRTVL